MHQFHHRTISLSYAAMAFALTAGVDHTLLAGIYLIIALTYWENSAR